MQLQICRYSAPEAVADTAFSGDLLDVTPRLTLFSFVGILFVICGFSELNFRQLVRLYQNEI